MLLEKDLMVNVMMKKCELSLKIGLSGSFAYDNTVNTPLCSFPSMSTSRLLLQLTKALHSAHWPDDLSIC